MDLLDFGAGQTPSITPSWQGIGATIQYLSGHNPYDQFRQQPVFNNYKDQQALKAGVKYSAPIFLKWLIKQQGAGLVIPSFTPDKDAGFLEKLTNAPVVSNILGRWLKVTDYGTQEKLMKQSQSLESQVAERYLQKKESIKRYVDIYKSNPSQGLINVERQLINEIFKVKGKATKAQLQGMAILKKQFRVAVRTGENKYLDQYFYSTTNAEKVSVLNQMKENTDKKEFDNTIKQLKVQGLISNEVLRKLYPR